MTTIRHRLFVLTDFCEIRIYPQVLPLRVFRGRPRSYRGTFPRAPWPYHCVPTLNRFFHNPPCVQELRFGQFWADQLQTGKRNAESVGSRNRHGQGRVAGEIHCDGVLERKDVRVENAYPQVEQRQERRCFLKGG